MSNYRIRMLPGVFMPVGVGLDEVRWMYEPTGDLWTFPNTMTAREITDIVTRNLTEKWELLVYEQMSCPPVQ